MKTRIIPKIPKVKIVPKVEWTGYETIYSINSCVLFKKIDPNREILNQVIKKIDNRYLTLVRKTFRKAFIFGEKMDYIYIPELDEGLKFVFRRVAAYAEQHIYRDPVEFIQDLMMLCRKHALYFDDTYLILLIDGETIFIEGYRTRTPIVYHLPYEAHVALINAANLGAMLDKLFVHKLDLWPKALRYVVRTIGPHLEVVFLRRAK